MVTANELLAEARTSRIKRVTICGQEFHLRKLPADVVQSIGQRAREGRPFGVPDWLEHGVCTEDGSPFFTAEQAIEYAGIEGVIAVRLVDALAVLSGFGGDETEKN